MLSDVLSAPPLGQMQSQVLAVAELHDVLVDQSAESDYNESCTCPEQCNAMSSQETERAPALLEGLQ